MKNTIWYAAGGSGGHLYPLLTHYLKNKKENNNYIFWSDNLPLSINIINQKKYFTLLHKILNYPKPKKNLKIFLFLFFTLFNLVKIVFCLLREKPNKIFLSGGYIGLPFVLGAHLCNIFLKKKIDIHIFHLDVIPGFAAKIISLFNPIQYILYEETTNYLYRSKYLKKTTYPIRYKKNDKISQLNAKKKLNIKQNLKTIFILGGSQGSTEINMLIESILKELNSENFFFIHQAGNDQKQVNFIYDSYKFNSYVFDFKDDISCFFSAADLIISRAGAGSIAEITFFEKKAILIPLKNIANNHQLKNAEIAKKNNKKIEIFSNRENLIKSIE